MHLVMKEACNAVISQVEQRFSQSDHLIAAKLVDSSLFLQFVLSFPTSELDCAVKLWPVEKTRENNLEEAFAETVTLLKMIITTPMTMSESERNFSTLKRIKNFSHNTMGQQRTGHAVHGQSADSAAT